MNPEKKKRLVQSALAIAGFVVIVSGVVLVYKTKFQAPSQAIIDAAFAKKDYPRVIELLGKTDFTNDQGANTYMLAFSHQELGYWDDALSNYMKADDLKFNQTEVRFAIASIYAEKGDDAVARNWLADAIESGISVESEQALPESTKKILDSEEWKKFSKEISARRGKSGIGPKFFEGIWEFSSGGTNSGDLIRFELMFDDTVVRETIQGFNGHEAVYVRATTGDEWDCTLTDANGRVFVGRAKFSDRLVVIGTLSYPDGTQIHMRIDSKTDGDSVEFIRHESLDGGETWDRIRRYVIRKDTTRREPVVF